MSKEIGSIVGIGASAGGLETLKEFLQNVRPDTGLAFIIIQHLAPDHKSMMADLLRRYTQMPIQVVDSAKRILPNQIYLIAPNTQLHIHQGELIPEQREETIPHGIDIFFRSLAEAYQHRSIGIILSGTISDGSNGLKNIKEMGGIVMAQLPSEAKFEGMPQAAIQTGLVDYIDTVKGIAQELNRLAQQTSALPISISEADLQQSEILTQVIHLIRLVTGTDFSYYKPPTLLRRIDKRMKMVGVDTLKGYYELLAHDQEELKTLAQEYYISVSSFFRDKEVWELINAEVIPALFTNKKEGEEVRVWIPGCATGEEAYSLAILLYQFRTDHKLTVDFRIFATDVDPEALSFASNGVYNSAIVEQVPAHLLDRYFEQRPNHYKIVKQIRERVIFSPHNIITSPPFIRMDLVSCRNTLIYLKSSTQQTIFKRFLFSLNEQGYLILGSSENLGAASEFFTVISPRINVFKLKRKANTHELRHMAAGLTPTTKTALIHDPKIQELTKNPNYQNNYLSDTYSTILINEHAPASLFVSYSFEILYIHGKLDHLIQLPQKHMRLLLLNMVSPELGVVMRHGMEKLKIEKREVVLRDVVAGDGLYHISFKDVWNEEFKEHNVLIQFYPASSEEEKLQGLPAEGRTNDYLLTLEKALQEKEMEIRFLQEQIESSSEELQASNEELQASNEELQSSNEELQSVNEELYTLNTELKGKIDEVVTSNNDLNKVLESTNIGALFVDDNLHIRRFTSEVVDIIPLKSEDIGRVILNFNTNLKRNYLSKDFSKVITKRQTIEREVTTRNGKHFLCQIFPIVLSNDRSDGAVAIFIDLTEKIQAEWDMRETNKRLEAAFKVANLGYASWDMLSNHMEGNQQFRNLIKLEKDESISLENYLQHVHPEDRQGVKTSIDAALNGVDTISLQYRLLNGEGEIRHISLVGNLLHYAKMNAKKMLLTFTDLTSIHLNQEKISQLGRMIDRSLNEIYVFDAQSLLFTSVNEGARKNLGYSLQELQRMTPLDIKPTFTAETFEECISPLRVGTIDLLKFETVHRRKDGSVYHVLVHLQLFQDEEFPVFVAMILDTTELVQAQKNLKESQERLELAINGTSEGIWDRPNLDSEYIYWSPRMYELLGTTPEETPATSENFRKLVHPDDREQMVRTLEEHYRKGTPFTADIRILHPTKGYRWFRSRGKALRDASGKPYRISGAISDIHESKIAELQLKESNRKLNIANEHLDNFVYAAAHDLRSPVINLKSLVSLIETENPHKQKLLHNIDKSVDRLEKTLYNMVKILELQQEDQPIGTSLNFESIIKDIQEELQIEWENIKPTLSLNLEVANINYVDAYLYSIIRNLISNALKYRAEQRPLNLRISTQNVDGKGVLLRVEDNGIGIDTERFAHKLFRPFVRLSKKGEGKGIGLYLIKTLVEKNGGQVNLEGKLGEGLCVNLLLLPYPTK